MERFDNIFKKYGLYWSRPEERKKYETIKRKSRPIVLKMKQGNISEEEMEKIAQDFFNSFLSVSRNEIKIVSGETLAMHSEQLAIMKTVPEELLEFLSVHIKKEGEKDFEIRFWGNPANVFEKLQTTPKGKNFLIKVEREWGEERRIRHLFEPQLKKRDYISSCLDCLRSGSAQLTNSGVLLKMEEEMREEIKKWINKQARG